jgi:hypothetical protein
MLYLLLAHFAHCLCHLSSPIPPSPFPPLTGASYAMLTTLSNLAGTVANSLAGAIAGQRIPPHTASPAPTPTLLTCIPFTTHIPAPAPTLLTCIPFTRGTLTSFVGIQIFLSSCHRASLILPPPSPHLVCSVGVWDVSNETLASHDYTGMWKLTLLCGCVQLLGKSNGMECAALQCSIVYSFAKDWNGVCCIAVQYSVFVC